MAYPVWPFVISCFLFSAIFVLFTRTILICKMMIVQRILFWPPLNSILEFCIRHTTSSILSLCFIYLFFCCGSLLVWWLCSASTTWDLLVTYMSMLCYCFSCSKSAVGWTQLKADLAWLASLGQPQFFQVLSTQAGWRVGKEWKQPCSSVKTVVVCSALPHAPWVWLCTWLYGYGYIVDRAEWRS